MDCELVDTTGDFLKLLVYKYMKNFIDVVSELDLSTGRNNILPDHKPYLTHRGFGGELSKDLIINIVQEVL